MSKSKKQVIPNLRFIVFKDDEKWDITTLGRLSIPVEDRAGEDRYTLMSVTSGVGLIPQTEKFGREIAGNSYKNYYVIQNGDFAYNKSATKLYPEGYIAMLQGHDNAALPNSIFTCFRIVDKESCPQFFNHLFSSNYHGKWLRKYITVGARANGALSVDNKYLWSMPVAIPKLNEQQKIAACFSSLDDLISAEDKKLATLKDHKKGLMKKLFPAEDKTLPEWRFSEFMECGEWEEQSLKTISDMRAGKFINASEIYKELKNEMYPCYGGNGLRGYTKTFTHSGEYSLIGRQGALCGNINYATGDFYATEHAVVVTAGDKIVERWLYYLLINLNLNQYATGQAQPGLSVQVIEKITVWVPRDIDEQQKIADCLSSIDDLITAQAEKIEVLKLHKIALMQCLFPSAQEVIE